MAQGLALLGGAAGAGEALQRLIAQRLLQARFEEEQRQAQAQESLGERTLTENAALRGAQQQATEQERQFQRQLHYDQLAQALTLGREGQAGQTARAQESVAAQNERASDAIASREAQAGAQRALQAQIAAWNQQLRTDTLSDKREAAEAEKANKRRAVVGLAQETSGVLDQLLTPEGALQPGVSGITGRLRVPRVLTGVPGVREAGSFFSGGDIANKQAALDRLKSRVVVDLIAEMKQQSRTGATGFGQLSEREGLLLERAAAQLDQAQTEDQVRDVLRDMRGKLNLIMAEPGSTPVQRGPSTGVPSTIVRWGRDAQGRPVRLP